MAKPVDNVLVKKPHQTQRFTAKQLQEFRKCMDPITGPMFFADNFCWVQHPTKGKIQYHPFKYQIELLNTYHNFRLSCNMLSRQLGKSITAAIYLLWFAMFKSDSTILIAAHKYKGAQEIMQRIRFLYECCPDHIRAGATEYNKGSISFDNGSRIEAHTTTENTGRGTSLSLLYCDEFSFVRPSVAKEFWTSISPALSTGGKCIITSTPNSDEDQFATIWKDSNKCIDSFGNPTDIGKNGFKAFKAYWYEHPDRDQEWADAERARVGDEKFEREHNLKFLISEETLINATKLSLLEGIMPIEMQGQIRWYKKPQKNKMYFVALDPSLGTGSDPAAIQIYEGPNLVQIGEWQHNRTPMPQQVNILVEITKYLDNIAGTENVYYSVENNTLGETALVAIEDKGEENIGGLFLSEPATMGSSRRYRKGFNTTNSKKLAACSKFKHLVESDLIKINSKNLISEMKNFIAIGPTFKAKTGETDDLVLSTLLIVRMVAQLQNYIPELGEVNISNEEYLLPMPFICA